MKQNTYMKQNIIKKCDNYIILARTRARTGKQVQLLKK